MVETLRTKTIKQTVLLDCKPETAFEILMNSKKQTKLIGAKAIISKKVGGKINIWNGYVTGKNLKIIKGKKIVQEWRGNEDCWPKDHFSTATFEFKNSGKGARLKTKLIFTQTKVPSGCFSNIKSGWTEYYWNPLKKMVNEEK